MPYVYVACLFFLGPTLLAWSYTLYLTGHWVIFRPTSEPRLARPLLSQIHGLAEGEIYHEGPLDGLYQQQQQDVAAYRMHQLEVQNQHGGTGSQISTHESTEEMQCEEAATLVPDTETASNSSTSRASTLNYGTVDHSPSALNFSCQVKIWDPYITKYLVYLVAVICMDLVLIMHVAIGMSIWPSTPRPGLLVL